MKYNKFVTKSGDVFLDLTDDNITPQDVRQGKLFHGKDGKPYIGAIEDGVEISGTEIIDGKLFIKLSNGDSLEAGTVVGPAGPAGISPKLQINSKTNLWEISTDNGASWESTGVKATGEDGTMTFADLTEDQKASLKGAEGKSAYEVALATNFTGSVEAWLESLKAKVQINADSNHWEIWNGTTWADTNVPATGDPGISITSISIGHPDAAENDGNLYVKLTGDDNPRNLGKVVGAAGATPTIQVADGSDVGTVGIPSVEAQTAGNVTTFTFHHLKGDKGDPGDSASSYIVPINDIYEVFKTYWNAKYTFTNADNSKYTIADPFVYASVNDSGWEPDITGSVPTLPKFTADDPAYLDNETSGLGRRNGMWFADSDIPQIPMYCIRDAKQERAELAPRNGSISMKKNADDTDAKKSYYYKIGQPINCSTIAGLVTMGIPYKYSKYNTDCTSYDVTAIREALKNNSDPNDDNDIRNSFNMYGTAITSSNYSKYFIAQRQLARCRELGLEKEALHTSWRWKEADWKDIGDGKKELQSNWYDCIAPTSDLREAQPGDLVFWNNAGESKTDPRAVSHVVLVLDRLSYESDRPDQPLLLLAEATSSSRYGIQVSYYMYDDRDNNDITGSKEHKIPKFICRPKYQRLAETPYEDISATYTKTTITNSDSGNYQVTPSIHASENVAEIAISCNTGSERRLVTIEFEWKPKDENSFLSIMNNSGVEVLRHYVPNCSAKVPYDVKLVVPMNAYISTSKKNEFSTLGNKIILREAIVSNVDEVTKGKDPVFSYFKPSGTDLLKTDNRIDIKNVSIYEGVKLPESLIY